MATYDVRWITRVEDVDSFTAAAKNAWADLILTIIDGKGATVIVVDKVEEDGTTHGAGVAFDMETPWKPAVMATNKIEDDDPEIFSESDATEATIFENVIGKMESMKNEIQKSEQEKFLRAFDDGKLAN